MAETTALGGARKHYEEKRDALRAEMDAGFGRINAIRLSAFSVGFGSAAVELFMAGLESRPI